jgi:2,5-dichloro-2,5-cyclohexadiene-1,4-diol dehydrogenase 1
LACYLQILEIVHGNDDVNGASIMNNGYRALCLEGKSILVTGGGSGIGRETALLLAQRGASVLVADIAEASAAATASEILRAGFSAAHIRVDISIEAEVDAMVAYAVAQFGGLHGAFNNAAISRVGPLVSDVDASQWQQVIDVNLSGTFHCLKYECRQMAINGGGSIVNMSSCAAFLGQKFTAAYCAAKAGVLGLTRATAAEFGAVGIRSNAIAPGAISTPMLRETLPANAAEVEMQIGKLYALGRIGQPREIAEAAAWLLSDAASFVTGIYLHVDGGYSSVSTMLQEL